jgi:hypothetical protein
MTSPFQHHELASRERGGVSRALLAVEERDLAEQRASRQIGEDHALPARPRQRHAHRAVEDHHHALARRANMKDRLTDIEALAAGMAGEFPSRAIVERAEQQALREELGNVWRRKFRGHGRPRLARPG